MKYRSYYDLDIRFKYFTIWWIFKEIYRKTFSRSGQCIPSFSFSMAFPSHSGHRPLIQIRLVAMPDQF